MDIFSKQELKVIVENLREEFKCPVCINTLRPPVILCTNGHGMCGECRSKLHQCPLCKKPFLTFTKNTLLDNVINSFPHTCRYDVCQVMVKPGVDDHEKWCGYKPTLCKLPMCNWTGSGSDLLDHIRISHEEVEIMSENNLHWHIRDVDGHFKSTFAPISALGRFFWMNTHKVKDALLYVTFINIPNGKIRSPLQISLLFGDSNRSCVSSKIYVSPEQWVNKTGITMKFSWSSVESLICCSNNSVCFNFSMAITD